MVMGGSYELKIVRHTRGLINFLPLSAVGPDGSPATGIPLRASNSLQTNCHIADETCSRIPVAGLCRRWLCALRRATERLGWRWPSSHIMDCYCDRVPWLDRFHSRWCSTGAPA